MTQQGYVSRITGWAAQPFSTQMNLGGWILFTILIVSVAILWVRGPLHHIVNA